MGGFLGAESLGNGWLKRFRRALSEATMTWMGVMGNEATHSPMHVIVTWLGREDRGKGGQRKQLGYHLIAIPTQSDYTLLQL